MKTNKNALFNQRARSPCFHLILMIFLFLLISAWALPTVPIEEDAVASTTTGALSSYLSEKGYQLSKIAFYNNVVISPVNNFRGVKLTYSSICGGLDII